MRKLIDLIIESYKINLSTFKIHCATQDKRSEVQHPLEAFFDGNFKEWQEDQSRRYFQCNEILSLIHFKEIHLKDKWLFAGIYKVLGEPQQRTKNEKIRYQYSTQEVADPEDLTGRVVVQFQKSFRFCYLIGEKHIDKLLISEIRNQRMSVYDFPRDQGKFI